MILSAAPKGLLQDLYDHYSYADSSAEYQLNRFMKSVKYIEAKWDEKFDTLDKFEAWRSEKLLDLKSKLVVYCCEVQIDALKIPIGLMQSLKAHFKKNHLLHTVNDHRNFDLVRKHMKGYCHELRRPQKEALDALLLDPVNMCRMATGVGKTVVGQEIIRHYGVRSLFLVPSKAILNQTIRRFNAAFGSSNVGKYGGGRKIQRWVTVATYQSVYAADADEFTDFDLVIADEVHHVPADTYYEVVENRLRNVVYRYGLTADEERSDGGTILVEAATGPVAYSYEAPQAIRDGYLAKPTFVIYEITRTGGTFINWIKDGKDNRIQDPKHPLNVSEAYTDEDHHKAYKNWILGNDLLTQRFAELAAAFKDDGKSVLILIDEKEHGAKLMAYLQQHGAVLVTGETDDNEKTLARFNARELKIIVATSTLGEGADTVPVDVLINLMGGTKAKQPNGRALRNDPDDCGVPRKPTTLIIDIDVPKSPVLHRHSELRELVHKECGQVYRSVLI